MSDVQHDHKGFSEEKCVRCGWVMGSPALNCNNDDTPHRFPSQAAWLAEAEARVGGVEEAVRLLQIIGLDITYTDDGLRVIARQIVGYGVAAERARIRTAVKALPHDPDCRSYRGGTCSCPWRTYTLDIIDKGDQ